MTTWQTFDGLVDYEESIKQMNITVQMMKVEPMCEQIWLMEYNPLYTAGTSAKFKDLLEKSRFPVYHAKRGGQYTYHGPGQRVIYPMLNLKNYRKDVRHYVWLLEEWIIQTLQEFGVAGQRQKNLVGIWVESGGVTEKIAAIGVRITKWISSYGISVNISPNLSHYDGIVPCGIQKQGVTSLEKLGIHISMPEFDQELKKVFEKVFS